MVDKDKQITHLKSRITALESSVAALQAMLNSELANGSDLVTLITELQNTLHVVAGKQDDFEMFTQTFGLKSVGDLITLITGGFDQLKVRQKALEKKFTDTEAAIDKRIDSRLGRRRLKMPV